MRKISGSVENCQKEVILSNYREAISKLLRKCFETLFVNQTRSVFSGSPGGAVLKLPDLLFQRSFSNFWSLSFEITSGENLIVQEKGIRK